jgi:hypothetical protein
MIPAFEALLAEPFRALEKCRTDAVYGNKEVCKSFAAIAPRGNAFQMVRLGRLYRSFQ